MVTQNARSVRESVSCFFHRILISFIAFPVKSPCSSNFMRHLMRHHSSEYNVVYLKWIQKRNITHPGVQYTSVPPPSHSQFLNEKSEQAIPSAWFIRVLQTQLVITITYANIYRVFTCCWSVKIHICTKTEIIVIFIVTRNIFLNGISFDSISKR